MNKPIKDVDSRFEGFICPACLVDFSSASQVQDHWLKFHSTSKPNSTASGQKDEKSHKFKLTFFGIAETCGVCHNDVVNYEGMYCEVCHFICHKKCEEMVKSKCGKRPSLSINTGSHSFSESSKNDGYLGYRLPKVQSPSAHKGIVKHLRHIVSKGRVRHVDKEFDLDLTYINDRVIAMSFPATGLETTYRNNLRDVAKMLQSKHQDKYMVFNLSERRYDISKLHHQVLDFGWPDHLAPPLERLCSIIKSIDSWLKSDPDHVVVVHCKGGKGRTGVVISAYMHFSKICSSPEAALDWFAMKRFYDDKLGGVTQPSQRRYVHYFSDYLDGKIKLSSDPIFLHHVIVHGIPNFDGKGGCKPFLRVYDGLKLIYTSGVFYVTQEMERICITIEGGLILHGDVLIKCYHKNTLSSGGDIIVRCQFHTGAIKDYSLVLDKMELDEAYRDKRFADGCKVEFVFSATGNFVTGIKDNKRLQSIIRNSLQPIENPDTVLMIPTADGQDEENWADSEGSSASTQELTKSTTKSLNARQACEDNNSGFGGRTRNHSGPTYVPGPLDGSLYAQVDKNLKKQIRSYSLDSGIHTRGSRDAEILDKPVLHSYKTGPLTSQETATLNRYQFSRNPKKVSSDGDITMDADLGGNIHSIDKLLKELGECSELLDNTIQQGRKSSERTTPNLTFQELSSIPIQTSQTGFKPINSSQTGSKPVYPPTPLRRAASYNATERYLEERHGVPAKVARKISNETRANNGIGGPYPSPSYTSTPKRQGIQEAPALKTHTRSLSPKFYATQTVVPSKTTVGQSRTPEENPIGGEPRTKGYAIGDSVDVRFGGVNGYHDNDVVMGSGMNGKGGEGDVNNNRTPTQNGDIENDEFRNEEDEFPRKGNVASKVAFLTEIVFPAHPPAERLPLKGTVPMPGLVGKSQTDISDEISKHNAKSLAVGELSHGGSTLYRGGAPQKISEAHPGRKDLSDKTLDPELVNKLKKVRDKSEVFDNEDLQTQPTEAQNVETESYDDGIDYKHTRARQDAQPGSPPVFMSNGPRDFTVGQPVLFSIPTDTKPSGRVDEDGYAELDDIHTTHHFARIEQAKPSPIVISRDIHTQPSMVAVLSSEPGHIQAIDGILSEMADINLAMPKENYDDDDNAGRPPTPQTPSSSISGPFDNTPRKKRSPFHSDKGYGSTNSLSSESSSNDVFVESPPAVPGVKFDKDTSQYWYKPSISREEAISLLKDKEPGYFVVRDSQSFPGAYGLAVRVAVPPAHVLQGDLTKIDLNIELIRHFLIESTKKGVKLRGISNEPVFGSLSALIFQHTITPLSLPIRLVIPTEDLLPSSSITDKTDGPASPKSPTTDTMQLMFVGECGVEMLSGTSAIQKTVESLLAYSAEPKFTSTSVRITKQGITVTDNERKVFFRKHFPINNVVYCGIDPLDQRWDLKIPSYTEKSRTFGLVVRKMGEIGNDCHLFAEMDSNYPINTVVNIVNKYMTG